MALRRRRANFSATAPTIRSRLQPPSAPSTMVAVSESCCSSAGNGGDVGERHCGSGRPGGGDAGGGLIAGAGGGVSGGGLDGGIGGGQRAVIRQFCMMQAGFSTGTHAGRSSGMYHSLDITGSVGPCGWRGGGSEHGEYPLVSGTSTAGTS